jgi:hypothetical protein
MQTNTGGHMCVLFVTFVFFLVNVWNHEKHERHEHESANELDAHPCSSMSQTENSARGNANGFPPVVAENIHRERWGGRREEGGEALIGSWRWNSFGTE